MKLPIALIGAGLIGRTHIDRALKHENVTLVAVADPFEAAQRLAEESGVRWFADYRDMLAQAKPQGVLIATPNATHAQIAIDCLAAGVPVIIEKPIADSVAEAQSIVDAAERAGLPALVGHQRRYNPIVRQARAWIEEGRIGRPVTATVMSTWLKPEPYFVPWRREKGGGPVLINLIHDIDLMLHFFGPAAQVQAQTSNAVRGFAVEDTAAAIVRFRNGALATFSLTDAAVSPWNYDLGAGEGARFVRQDINALFLSGTQGSISLPQLELWRYEGAEQHWEAPLTRTRTALHTACPYVEQLRHFAAVIAGRETPVCSALDALRTLQTTEAVLTSAEQGLPIDLPG